MTSIIIKKVTSKIDIAKCLQVRAKVFIDGQGVPQDIEQDGKDSECFHFLVESDEVPVGAGRVRYIGEKAKIERVAVLMEYQGKGFGKKLMEEIMEYIKLSKKASIISLASQTHAIKFYENLGFSICSDEYIDAEIPHKDMHLVL